ncbi:MAG: hypothetical protein N4A33_01195 [Bacteriovoracaceae bacterium]|jgi:hypothetical protein|nr:hypothetical protein [Bacteriovoracaceae bacterium]
MNIEEIKFLEIDLENLADFYGLGSIDTNSYKNLHKSVCNLALKNSIFEKIVKMATTWQSKNTTKDSLFHEVMRVYSKGLKVSTDELYFTLLLPEFVSSFNKWMPNLLGFIPGCSSLFTKCESSEAIIHSRILDYPAGVSFNENEKAIRIKSKKYFDIFGYTTTSLPLPVISSMNEEGLTLALHYKHGDYFNIEGSSIFEICFDILLHCSDVIQAKKRLKRHKSISHWGIYLSDKNSKIASIDIRGEQTHFELLELHKKNFLYFNNRLQYQNEKTFKMQPFGNRDHCLMKSEFITNSIANNYPSCSLDALKLLTSTKQNSFSWNQSPLGICAIQALSYNNKTMESYYITGQSPKFNTQNILKFKNVFKNKYEVIQGHTEENNFQKGYRHLSKAQLSIDQSNTVKAYYHIQFAIEYLEGSYEQIIARFYFYVLEYINTSDNKELYYLLKNFRQIFNDLPPYLKDHCYLFIFRIKKILGETIDESDESYLKNPNLIEILNKEKKLKPFSLKMLKKLIYPRIEILDIIYIYS